MDIQEKINALMEKDEFRQEFENLVDPEGVVELFGRNGVEVPLEIAEELFMPVLPEEGELSPDDLEDVAGGTWKGVKTGAKIGKSIFYGAGYLGGRLAGWSKSKSASYANKCSYLGVGLGGALGGLVM